MSRLENINLSSNEVYTLMNREFFSCGGESLICKTSSYKTLYKIFTKLLGIQINLISAEFIPGKIPGKLSGGNGLPDIDQPGAVGKTANELLRRHPLAKLP